MAGANPAQITGYPPEPNQSTVSDPCGPHYGFVVPHLRLPWNGVGVLGYGLRKPNRLANRFAGPLSDGSRNKAKDAAQRTGRFRSRAFLFAGDAGDDITETLGPRYLIS